MHQFCLSLVYLLFSTIRGTSTYLGNSVDAACHEGSPASLVPGREESVWDSELELVLYLLMIKDILMSTHVAPQPLPVSPWKYS